VVNHSSLIGLSVPRHYGYSMTLDCDSFRNAHNTLTTKHIRKPRFCKAVIFQGNPGYYFLELDSYFAGAIVIANLSHPRDETEQDSKG